MQGGTAHSLGGRYLMAPQQGAPPTTYGMAQGLAPADAGAASAAGEQQPALLEGISTGQSMRTVFAQAQPRRIMGYPQAVVTPQPGEAVASIASGPWTSAALAWSAPADAPALVTSRVVSGAAPGQAYAPWRSPEVSTRLAVLRGELPSSAHQLSAMPGQMGNSSAYMGQLHSTQGLSQQPLPQTQAREKDFQGLGQAEEAQVAVALAGADASQPVPTGAVGFGAGVGGTVAGPRRARSLESSTRPAQGMSRSVVPPAVRVSSCYAPAAPRTPAVAGASRPSSFVPQIPAAHAGVPGGGAALESVRFFDGLHRPETSPLFATKRAGDDDRLLVSVQSVRAAPVHIEGVASASSRAYRAPQAVYQRASPSSPASAIVHGTAGASKSAQGGAPSDVLNTSPPLMRYVVKDGCVEKQQDTLRPTTVPAVAAAAMAAVKEAVARNALLPSRAMLQQPTEGTNIDGAAKGSGQVAVDVQDVSTTPPGTCRSRAR